MKVEAVEIEYDGNDLVEVYEVREEGRKKVREDRFSRYRDFWNFRILFIYPLIEEYFGSIEYEEPVEGTGLVPSDRYYNRFIVVRRRDNGERRYVYEYIHVYPCVSLDFRNCSWFYKIGWGSKVEG